MGEDRAAEGRSTTALTTFATALTKRSLTDCGLSVRRLRICSRVDHARHLLLQLISAEDGLTGRSLLAVVDDKDDDPRTAEETLRVPNVKDVQIDV